MLKFKPCATKFQSKLRHSSCCWWWGMLPNPDVSLPSCLDVHMPHSHHDIAIVVPYDSKISRISYLNHSAHFSQDIVSCGCFPFSPLFPGSCLRRGGLLGLCIQSQTSPILRCSRSGQYACGTSHGPGTRVLVELTAICTWRISFGTLYQLAIAVGVET
ncbi:hypothetical protein BDN72DRAFT_483008 [Pluteus cervinus]|uniref:Uncharacterized protein n=1 Tax=Pluteus cervinus TaxID=181527 RepID=A0ACD3B0R6_9AGAR|nr:hypothetical protein BDN72DRAFT_483008 [Pluteus cervinus]